MKKLLKLLVLAFLIGGNTIISAQDSMKANVYLEQKIEGDTLKLCMAGTNLGEIVSFQFGIEFDSAALSYVSLESDILTIEPTNVQFDQTINVLKGVWSSPNAGGYTFSDYKSFITLIFYRKLDRERYCFTFAEAKYRFEFHNEFYTLKVEKYGSCDPFDLGYGFAKGIVSNHPNDSCIDLITNKAISNATVKFTKGNNSYYTKTDEKGAFSKMLPAGDLEMEVFGPNDYFASCHSIQTVRIDSAKTNSSIRETFTRSINCPDMSVNLSATFLRACVENPVKLTYRNQGTITAQNAYIILSLDDSLRLVSATKSYTSLGAQHFRFDLGNVESLEAGEIILSVLPTCALDWRNRTLCMEAEIFPDTICIQSSIWNGANIKLQSKCENNEVKFTVINNGLADISDLAFTTIEDDLMPGINGKMDLKKGQSKEFKYPANGRTIRMIIDTLAHHPYQNKFTKAVEGCGTNSQGTISTGFVNTFLQGDESPRYDIECHEIRRSFDPNDKMAIPTGYENTHLIEKGQRLEYMIRFQNTGNDTAFKIVIVDTLSQNLDLSTLEIIGASHPFTWDLLRHNILRFNFFPIKLVDSTSNEPVSHGYVKYAIKTKEQLALGSTIENTAYIYFDFNPAIVTNQTLHTIGNPSITAIFDEPATMQKVKVYPNPFHTTVQFELKEELSRLDNIKIELLDGMGKRILIKNFNHKTISLHANELPNTNIIFFKVYNNDKVISTGKLIQVKYN